MITLLTVVTTEATRQAKSADRIKLANSRDPQFSFAGTFARAVGSLIRLFNGSWLIQSRIRQFQPFPKEEPAICDAR